MPPLRSAIDLRPHIRGSRRQHPLFFILAALCGCGVSDVPESQASAPSASKSDGAADEPGAGGGGGGPTSVLGLHGPWPPRATDSTVDELFRGGKGWLVDVVYTTDSTWLSESKWSAAARDGYNVALRVDYARGTNVPPDGEVDHCPTGAEGSQTQHPRHDLCFAFGLQEVVSSNPDVHRWIIGNEPNLRSEALLFPEGTIDAARFAEVYRFSRDAVHLVAGHANDVVYLGGVSPGSADADGDRYEDGVEYLGATLAALADSPPDAVALHAYAGHISSQDTGEAAYQRFDHQLTSQQQTMVNAGLSDTPVLLSEFNITYDPSGVDADPQGSDATVGAHILRTIVNRVHQRHSERPDIEGAVWFTWGRGEANAWDGLSMDFWWERLEGASEQTQQVNWAAVFGDITEQHRHHVFLPIVPTGP